MSNEAETAANANSSVPEGYSTRDAMQLANDRRAERVRFRLEATRMVEEEKRKAAAPRLRAKAAAEEAATVAIETLGVHDQLTDAPEFRHLQTAREGIHQAVVTAFQSMARVFDNEFLNGPEGIAQVAKIGRETLTQYVDRIDGLRNDLRRTQGDVEQRLQAAMTPPAHLASMVEQARDALRSMSAKDRDTLIANAKGDDLTILRYAIAGAPTFLTGASTEQRNAQRDVLIGLRDPKLLPLEPGLPKAFAALDKMEAGITRLVGSVASFDTAEALAALRKA